MIQETMTHVCRACKSTDIVKNGTNRCGNAQYHCKNCGTYRVLKPKPAYVETHRCVGKETGETAHMERWNNTLRQRVGRYVRQTLSFSQCDVNHHLITKWFIVQYNLNLSLTT